MTQALARIELIPGVLIRSVEMDEHSLDHNGMATPAVVPMPPPLEADPAA
ncbi:hypothetical protein [Streptomyces clavuligerus]|nr:hypothetical protein [Streptomyces clavuligerus]MBY6302891.1 hypothetical protein [Streptomyces clavuligerus]QPL66840.1 hypothetical protein I3J04_09360 [Streptomyces clavuligerus]QPL72870.1 hypothetical protein I3J05_09375 [Streptomyces clavuligerus]QPL78946.1 hypothetical protein I3J06_09375 [Streptomyces clavuligerus]QPL84974.1 hypothetical protein I3J07_09415 [Streptomyces clavuligerus]